MKLRTTFLATLAAGTLLSGCQDFQDAQHRETDVMNTAERQHVPNIPVISESDKPWLLGDAIKDVDPIPDLLKHPAAITIARPTSLRDAAILASRLTSVPVRIMPDAEDADDGSEIGTGTPQSVSFNGTNLPPPPVMSAMSAALGNKGKSARQSWNGSGDWLKYDGTREGVFQALATRFGVWQRFVDDHVEFYRTLTKTFTVPAFAGDTQANTSIIAYTGGGSGSSGSSSGSSGGGGASTGSGSSSGQSSGQSSGIASVSSTSKTNRWKTIEHTAQIVSGGASVVADEGLGTLSATGTPDQIARVDDWMKNLNDGLMKQVAVEVHVYTVKVSHESNYGWSPQLALKNYGKAFGMAAMPAAIPALQSADTPFSFGASILDTATGATGQFSGTKFVVQALQQLGNVTEQYDRGVVTTNGVTAPFQNGINTTYLANTTTTLATNAGSANSLSPGVIMSGFMGSVTPKIVDNRILLRVNFLLQTLLSIQTITSNGSSLQAPKSSNTSLDDTVALQNGSTLVLSGYVDDATSRTRNGVGSALNWVTGGGGDAQVSKTHVVVTVEARTL